jgi:hypothetical protein
MQTSVPASPVPTQEQITLTIKGYTFQLLAPYAPGQPLGLAEAGILNREWTQSIRLGYQEIIEKAITNAGGQLDHQALAAVQLAFQHYADEFVFKALSQSRNADPLLRQKHSIAKRILDIRLNATGQSRQSFGEHKYEAALVRLMNNPTVVEQAQQQLLANREAADMLAGMGNS